MFSFFGNNKVECKHFLHEYLWKQHACVVQSAKPVQSTETSVDQ